MNWTEVEINIRRKIKPGSQGILKCLGNVRRPIISNDGNIIRIKTGIKSNRTKTISYEMIQFAFNRIIENEKFDSQYFRSRFSKEYKNGSCIYSIVGGVLVEMGVAQRHPKGNSCYYTKR